MSLALKLIKEGVWYEEESQEIALLFGVYFNSFIDSVYGTFEPKDSELLARMNDFLHHRDIPLGAIDVTHPDEFTRMWKFRHRLC